MSGRIGPWVAFAGWALFGAVFAVAMLSFTLFASIPLIAAVALAFWKPSVLRSGSGVLAGIGLVSLYVAWLQRHGPGTTCSYTPTEVSCQESLNPWPWLVVGVVLVVIGVVAHRHRLGSLQAV